MKQAQVFIVDDDEAVRDSLALFLELSNLSVQQYASAELFLQNVNRDARGCLLLDLRMPGLDGLGLQRRLTQEGYRLHVVIITAHGDVAAARNALKSGAVDFLEKPINEVHLLASVREAINMSNAQHHQQQQNEQAQKKLARLTERESEVLSCVAAGATSREIGEQLGISQRTVEVYRARLMDKLNVTSLPDLVRLHLSASDHRH